jgi:hypothetical protein
MSTKIYTCSLNRVSNQFDPVPGTIILLRAIKTIRENRLGQFAWPKRCAPT